MLAVLEFIFSSWKTYLGFLVMLWMVCPWLHTRKSLHIFGRRPAPKPKQQASSDDKKDQVKLTL